MFHRDNLECKLSMHKDPQPTIEVGITVVEEQMELTCAQPFPDQSFFFPLKCLCMDRKEEEEAEMIKDKHKYLDWQGQTNDVASSALLQSCRVLCKAQISEIRSPTLQFTNFYLGTLSETETQETSYFWCKKGWLL